MNGSFWKKRKAGSVFLAVLLLTTLLAGCGINEGKAEKYVQANLDLTFQGQTQEAKEILGASDSDLKKDYEKGISSFVQVYEIGINAFVQDCLLNGVETENDFSETYGVLIKEIFSSARYQVSGVKKTGSKTCEVTVKYQPVDVFTRFMTKMKEESEKIQADKDAGKYSGTDEEIKEAMVLDYMTGAYSLLRSSYLDMQYGEKQEYTFTVTQKGRNTWSLGDEELNGFIERILELDKL